jgi:sodium pump decarboxylase gamma subunit
MNPLLLPLATTTEDLGHSHSVMDALPHLGGMLMVLITLTILWGLTILISKLVAKLPAGTATPTTAKAAAAAPTPSPSTAATPAPAPDGLSLEIVAVIAAAVAATAGPDRRIISIRGTSRSWEMAGRQSVLTSHRIR